MSQCTSCGGFCKKSGCERADYVPPKQEPVAKVCHDLAQHIGWNPAVNVAELPEGMRLYTAPPQRTLVLLTTQEVSAIAERVYGSAHQDDITFGTELQIKLKEKNQ